MSLLLLLRLGSSFLSFPLSNRTGSCLGSSLTRCICYAYCLAVGDRGEVWSPDRTRGLPKERPCVAGVLAALAYGHSPGKTSLLPRVAAKRAPY
jgi:hypothetical protein